MYISDEQAGGADDTHESEGQGEGRGMGKALRAVLDACDGVDSQLAPMTAGKDDVADAVKDLQERIDFLRDLAAAIEDSE